MFRTLAVVLALVSTVYCVQFQITNSGGSSIFIQVLGNEVVDPFTLGPGAGRTLEFAELWSGRVWGRTDCSTVADCNNGGFIPASLAEMTIDGSNAWYDLSLVDGFNVPLSFGPVGGTPDGTKYRCGQADCSYNILSDCPSELRLNNPAGQYVSCESACNAFNDDFYCCRGAHDTPETCRSSDWPQDYASFFKSRCPDAYSYAYDDQLSTYTCDSHTYNIVFK